MDSDNKEKRKSIVCPYCGTHMVCMNKFTAVVKTLKGIFVWYVCPRRTGEIGCGHTMPVEAESVKSENDRAEE